MERGKKKSFKKHVTNFTGEYYVYIVFIKSL